MKINAASLQSRVQTKVKELGIDANQLYTMYYFDCLVKRISLSIYNQVFVFKGGFLLSSMVGVIHRLTRDMDFSFQEKEFNQSNLTERIKEIISIDADDLVIFELLSIVPMKDNDEEDGYRVNLKARLENITTIFHMDVAYGDPITPSEIKYSYTTLITKETLGVYSYNVESILAEKIQTILDRSTLNSRSKDFYDVYILHKMKFQEINPIYLKQAFLETCTYRNTPFSNEDINTIVDTLESDEMINNRWLVYLKSNPYANNTSFSSTIFALRAIVQLLEVNAV